MDSIGLLIIGMIALIGMLVVGILFLLTISRTLRLVDYNNRLVQPDQVWLLLIPLFNLYWIFVLTRNVSYSIRNQFRDRGVAVPPKPTYALGLTFSIASLLSTFSSWSFLVEIPQLVSSVLGLVATVAWIAYWVSLSDYKRQLGKLPPKEESLIFGNIPVQY